MNIQKATLTKAMLTVLIIVSIPALGMAQGQVDRQAVFSTNPILDMFEWYNAELELKVAPATTIGLSGTYFVFKQEETYYDGMNSATLEVDDQYFSIYGFMRYYMQGESFKGFYLSGRLGYNKVDANGWVIDDDTGRGEWVEETGDFLGFGIDVGYSWLLGKEERFAVSLGIGAVRLFGGDLENADVNFTLPTIRLINVGVAF